MELQVGSILEGKVTSITKFGAFVALDNGKSGLVHISEIANTFVNDVHDYLQEGQAVKVLVLSTENGKVNLSIKRTLPRPERPARSPRPSGSHPAGTSRPVAQARPAARAQQPLPPSGDQSFEDKLKQFLSSSEGKMADLNRSLDGRRGGAENPRARAMPAGLFHVRRIKKGRPAVSRCAAQAGGILESFRDYHTPALHPL